MSNKLSIVAVLGLATLPVLPLDAASGVGADVGPARPIEMVHAKPVPITEGAPADPAFQLAARRSRVKREPPPEAKEPAAKEPANPPAAKEATKPASSAEHKTSSISGPEAEKIPLPSPTGSKPAEAAQVEPPKPDVWSDAQVIAALRECVKLLAPIAADVEISEPVKHEQCGAAAPVMLRRIGSGANKVEINPPAMVNCAMVVGLHSWVEKTLQPAAQEAFGSPITRLRNASGYACRTRVGTQFHADRLSEHALANAIDIAGFVTADGRTIEVARHWGPTARDQREAEKVAAAGSKAGPPADKGEKPKIERASNRKISAISQAAAEPEKGKSKSTPMQTAELQKLGRSTSDVSADPKAIPAPPAPGREDVTKSTEAQFLRRLHKGACGGPFGTVLGPEANEAHRDHFHLDLAHRRNSAYCQ